VLQKLSIDQLSLSWERDDSADIFYSSEHADVVTVVGYDSGNG
jgi:hypothetical protein